MKRLPAVFLAFGAMSLLSAPCRADAGAVAKVSRASVTPGVAAAANDPAWRGPAMGVHLSPLFQDEGRAEDFRTDVELRWDAECLYVRFWCRATQAPWAPHGDERDAHHHNGDVVEVFLDPAGDARQVIELQVSPANGVYDCLYLLTGEPRSNAAGVLLSEVLKRDQWEFPEWNWPGLRCAAAAWVESGKTVGWIADLALPAEPILHRLGGRELRDGLGLHAHLVRNACPLEDASRLDGKRAFLSYSWRPIPVGRPHRAPSKMGSLELSTE